MANVRVDVSKSRIENLITTKGYVLTHLKAIPCPCSNVQTGQPDPNCVLCDKGWQYYDSENIQGIITGITAEKQYAETGGLFLGSMTLTVLASVELGFHDRIIHKQSTMVFSEVLAKNSGDTDVLRYEPVEIRKTIGPSGPVYVQGVDFDVTDKIITWRTLNRPADGSSFSIAYVINPIWLVLSYVHLVRDTQVKFRNPAPLHTRLPIQAMCKLEFLVEN